MKLRLELSKKEENFKNIINDKEELISALKNEISELQQNSNSGEINIDSVISSNKDSLIKDERLEKFFRNESAISFFEVIANYINHGWSFESKNIP